jgi:hypothetical protein
MGNKALIFYHKKLPLFLCLNLKILPNFISRKEIYPTILETGISPVIKQSYNFKLYLKL